MQINQIPRFVLGALLVFIAAVAPGCSKDWWTRGQPPAVSELVDRSHNQLSTVISSRGSVRPQEAELAKQIEQSLAEAWKLSKNNAPAPSIADKLTVARTSFITLGDKLSVGSRPAYGELSGQLRTFIQGVSSGQAVDSAALGLYAARTSFFLADELSVPGPSF